MRKAVAILILCALLFVFTSCGKKSETVLANTTTANTTTTVSSTPLAEEKKVEKSYKLGMGVVFVDNTTEDEAQYDCTVAAVVTDENGVVVRVKIDDAQNKMEIDAIDSEKTFRSKKELEFEYNMVKYSEAKYEWFEQIKAFEDYCVGKTLSEIKNTKTRVRTSDEPHPGYVVAADETLFAQCSIQITDYILAVCKAIEDKHSQSFTYDSVFKLGLKLDSTAVETVPMTDDRDGIIKMYSSFGAAVCDEDGKILASLTDAIQPQNKVSADDKKIEEAIYKGSKKELEFDYNMAKYSEATNEWFEQADAFEKYSVGLLSDEVENLPTRVRTEDEPHPGYVVTVDPDLFAQCSIQITEFKRVIAEAAKNAD